MRSRSDTKIIRLFREQYERHLYSRLVEMDVTTSGGKLLLDAGLEVKNIKTGEKFTVQSVQKNGSDITVSLISPENVTGPITSDSGTTVVSPGQPPQVYSLEEFEKNFKV
jgi:hypothetical protein